MAVDVVQGRLERARANGAEAVAHATEDDVAAHILEWTNGEGPAVVFEATGVTQVLRTAIEVVAHSGTVVVAGTSEQEVSVPSHILVQKEMDLLGSRNNSGLFKEAVDLVRMYRARCEQLITQRFPLEEIEAALEFGEANPDVSNKMIIQVAGR